MRTPTILLVEDNDQNAYLATYLLEKSGCRIVWVKTGPQGIVTAERVTPDLILLDVELPEMNGYAVARELRKRPSLAAVPIIAVTSYAMVGDREKALDAGCTDYIEKPINPDTFVADVRQAPARRRRRRTMSRILIVDDDPQGLYMLEALLKGHGHEVVTAVNGSDALEKARRNPPDIIISDFFMPTMDGFALCRECKKDDRLKDVPFIAYTATYTDPKDEELALSLGAARFLVKPIEPEVLLREVEQVLADAKAGRLPPPPEPAYAGTAPAGVQRGPDPQAGSQGHTVPGNQPRPAGGDRPTPAGGGVVAGERGTLSRTG